MIKVDVGSLKEDQNEFIKNNKLILRMQKRLRSENHKIFIEKINKIALNLNDDKRIQLIHSIEKYARGTSKDLVCKKIKLNVTV